MLFILKFTRLIIVNQNTHNNCNGVYKYVYQLFLIKGGSQPMNLPRTSDGSVTPLHVMIQHFEYTFEYNLNTSKCLRFPNTYMHFKRPLKETKLVDIQK